MTEQELEKLHKAWWWCDEQDKSTEFMFQYMSDVSGVSYGDVVDFVMHTSLNDRLKFRKLPAQQQKEFNDIRGGDKLVGLWVTADITLRNKKPKIFRAKIIKYKRYHNRSNNKYLIELENGQQKYIKRSQMSDLTPYRDKDKKLGDESKS